MNHQQRKLDQLDDRMMQCYWVEKAFHHGIQVGRIFATEMESWYRNGCKGPMPELMHKHTSEHYLQRNLRKQFYKIVKEMK